MYICQFLFDSSLDEFKDCDLGGWPRDKKNRNQTEAEIPKTEAEMSNSEPDISDPFFPLTRKLQPSDNKFLTR